MQRPLKITVDPSGWNTVKGTRVQDHVAWIKSVLQSAAAEIWNFCPTTTLDSIIVRHSCEGPSAVIKRDDRGRIVVHIHSEGLLWAQFAYQFSHEFCHLLTLQSNDVSKIWQDYSHANQWLEECICETASVFALRRMAEVWKTTPPYVGWKTYSGNLTGYAQGILDAPQNQLPAGTTFLDWLQKHETELRARPITLVKDEDEKKRLRSMFVVVARQLLPIFESCPSGWESVTCFNLVPRIADKTLAQHLADWYLACPALLKPFVVRLTAVFGVLLQAQLPEQ